MRRQISNQKLWDKVFLSLVIFWGLAFETLCFMVLVDEYRKFISTTGIFFLPLMSSIWVIILLIWLFVFRYPTLKETKAQLSNVYKKGNVSTQDFNEIGNSIDKAIANQNEKEYLEIKKELEQASALEQTKNAGLIEIFKKTQQG